MIHTYRFADYRDVIAALPVPRVDSRYEKKELIADRFLLFSDGPLSAYYAPFHYDNPKARVALVGVTPGFTQMECAFRTARVCLAEGIDDEEVIFRRVVQASAFAGSMRKLLVQWFDTIGLSQHLGIATCDSLFENASDWLVHSTSVVSAPIFKDGKNWAGQASLLLKLPKFKRFIVENLAVELASLTNAVIVPLGKTAGEIIEFLNRDGRVSLDRCLLRFPHPSGLNGHRFQWFDAGRDRWSNQLRDWFA